MTIISDLKIVKNVCTVELKDGSNKVIEVTGARNKVVRFDMASEDTAKDTMNQIKEQIRYEATMSNYKAVIELGTDGSVIKLHTN